MIGEGSNCASHMEQWMHKTQGCHFYTRATKSAGKRYAICLPIRQSVRTYRNVSQSVSQSVVGPGLFSDIYIDINGISCEKRNLLVN